MSRIRIVVSDLDGTLLQNGAQKLEPEIFELIRCMREKEILFFAASGRQYPNLQRLFAPVRDEIGYICENGCLAFWKGEVLYEARMEQDLGREIIQTARRREGEEILRSGRLTSYLEPKEESYLIHMRDIVKNNVTVVEDILAAPEAFNKISIYNRNGIRDSIAFWKKTFGTRASVVMSGEQWIDLTPLGANKGNALAAVCEHFGILPEECMAFGDNENDLEMLQFAGYAWGMEKSHPEVKKSCGHFTSSVEDVLMRLLEI